MGKLIKFVGILFLLLLLIGLFFLAANLGSIIERGINDYGSEIVGVPVSVGSVNVSLLGGSASIYSLAVANPAGFTEKSAFELGEVALALDLQSLRSDVIYIEKILVDGATINAEQKGAKLNLRVLQQKLAAGSAPEDASSAKQDSNEVSRPASIAIEQFVFSGARAQVASDQFDTQEVDVPTIELNKIGSRDQGITTSELGSVLLEPLMQRIVEEVQKQALDQALKKEVNKALDDAIKSDKVKGFLDKL